MGSDTGNGGEEENRFMMDCYKTGYSVKNYDKYNECISMRVMLYSAFEGFFENRINKCAKKYIGVNKLMISTPLYYNVKPLLLAA